MKIVVGIVAALAVIGVGWWAWQAEGGGQIAATDQYSYGQQATTTQPQGQSTGGNTTSNPSTNKMTAVIKTSMGDITLELFASQTPKTVENFVKLAKQGFYDGTKFHRVIKGFMNQGGDPLTKDDSKMAMWGTGGPGYQFADEITPQNANTVGTISMANAGPNTNGSQFFINVADNSFLNTKHTVFGKVTAGMDVVTKINMTETNSADRPLTPVVVQTIVIQ